MGWDDLHMVLMLVRHGTLATAGQAVGVAYTTVARRVQRAEAALNTPLFDRLSDGYHPTEAGRAVARYAAEMEQRDLALQRELASNDQTLVGPLTVTAPELLIGPYIAPVLAQLADTEPGIDVSIRATNDLLDLSRRAADIAIRISRNPGDSLTGLRLAEQHSASFAAPEMAEALAQNPADEVQWILHSSALGPPRASLERYPNARVRFRFDDMVAVIGAARAGLGVARMPRFLGRSEPGLVQVPVLPPQPYMDIWVVAHADIWRSRRVAAFRKALVPYFRARRAEFIDASAG
ncbi:LysR family transcriptional regulator [Rhodophyticola sp. CCM32]|nr:LysR family transcriptional regulator [Rhodophyticola sp. CCM32]